MFRLQHGRHGAASVLLGADLRLQHAQPARPVSFDFAGSFDQRVATLNDPTQNHAMKDGAVVGSGFRLLDEVADVVGREVGTQVDDERARARRHHRLLVRQLRERWTLSRLWLGRSLRKQ